LAANTPCLPFAHCCTQTHAPWAEIASLAAPRPAHCSHTAHMGNWATRSRALSWCIAYGDDPRPAGPLGNWEDRWELIFLGRHLACDGWIERLGPLWIGQKKKLKHGLKMDWNKIKLSFIPIHSTHVDWIRYIYIQTRPKGGTRAFFNTTSAVFFSERTLFSSHNKSA